MNLTISQRHQENIVNIIQKRMDNLNFSDSNIIDDSNIICSIKVNAVEDEEDLKKGYIFYLTVQVTKKMVTFRLGKIKSVKIAIYDKIKQEIGNWFPFDDTNFWINFVIGVC